jgi:glycerol-3-phosphate acyltransferase PlsY
VTTGEIILIAALFVTAYLAGAIPFGLVIGKIFYGVDLFALGSKSMGATNAFRILGWKAGLWVFVGDFFKGLLVTLFAGLILPEAPWVQAGVAVFAVFGHSWSVFAGFRGGRGVATAFGAVWVIYPIAGLAGGIVSISIVVVLRYVSLGSLMGTLAAVLVGAVLYLSGLWRSPWGLIFMGPTAALIIWQHRPNIGRLATGTELQLAEWPTYFARAGKARVGDKSGE